MKGRLTALAWLELYYPADAIKFRYNAPPVFYNKTIGGAFTWAYTKEGHDYWQRLDILYYDYHNKTPKGNIKL